MRRERGRLPSAVRSGEAAGGAAPAGVLQAVANIVKHPSYPAWPDDSLDPVFQLSATNPLYRSALPHRPTGWLLFLKITGGFYSAQVIGPPVPFR